MSVTLISVSYDTVVSNKHEEQTRHYYVNFQQKSNALISEFHTMGWKYYDYFMHILPSGASSGVKSFRGIGRKSAVTMSGMDSPDSASIAAASSVLPHDLLASGGDLSAVGSITLANTSSNIHASIPGIPQATSPPGTTAIDSSNGKRLHSMISPNITNPSDNLLLLSLSVPLPPSTAPSQVPTKYS